MRFQHDPFGKDLYGVGHAIFVPSLWRNDPNVYLPGFTWTARDPNVANEGYNTRAVYYAPRFGEAWDVFGNGKTVIRGGRRSLPVSRSNYEFRRHHWSGSTDWVHHLQCAHSPRHDPG